MTRDEHPTPTTPDPAAIPDRYESPPVPGAGTLAVLALAWLLAVLSSARQMIGAAPDASDMVITQAALALPVVISASLLAGLAVGLVAVNLTARWAPRIVDRTWRPVGIGAGAGALVGLAIAAMPVLLGYGGLPSILILCGAVASAATLGGLLAGVRHRLVLAAGVTGGLGVFLVGFVVGVFDGDLLNLFGAGDTAESVTAANAWVRLTAALMAGLAAGVLGYAYLRRSSPGTLRWPAYLVAGAMPGLLVLLAEAITRLGGARLFQLVSEASAGDQAVLNYLNATRFNRAMIVLFVGALVAIFLLGRTLRPDPAQPQTEADAGAEAEADAEAGADAGAEGQPRVSS